MTLETVAFDDGFATVQVRDSFVTVDDGFVTVDDGFATVDDGFATVETGVATVDLVFFFAIDGLIFGCATFIATLLK